MTFVPPSSFASGSVTIVGTVQADVTDRAARLLGHVTVDNASLAVTGPQTDAEFAARLPFAVSGPLTDAQLAARLPLPMSAASLPLPDGAATEDALADAVGALNDVALTAILEREKIETG